MNFIELTRATGRSPEEIKTVLLEKFRTIILSELIPLEEEVIRYFLPQNAVAPPIKYTETVQKPEPSPDLTYTRRLLRHCIRNGYLFIIDCCSLLHRSFYDFYRIFLEEKSGTDTCLIVPYAVAVELDRLGNDPDALPPKKREQAKDLLLRMLPEEVKKNNVAIVGSHADKRRNCRYRNERTFFADSVITEKLLFFRNDGKSVLFITQDNNATKDALMLNTMQASESHAKIIVKKIAKEGLLVNNTKETVNPILPIDDSDRTQNNDAKKGCIT